MSQATEPSRELILELVTEELPPKSLDALGRAFATGVHDTLAQLGLLAPGCRVTDYATPRPLAVHLSHVLRHAPDHAYRQQLKPVKLGLHDSGPITAASDKKLSANALSQLYAAAPVRRSTRHPRNAKSAASRV